MTTDFTKPEVYSLSVKQGMAMALVGLMMLPIAYMCSWFSLGEININFILFVLILPLVLYALSPRLVLAPEGITVTICRIPWLRQIPWGKIKRAGMPYSGNWIWLERHDQISGWIWIAILKIDGPELLERIAIRYAQHVNQYCRNCNYHLRGNTTGVCPECGEIATEQFTPLRIDIQPKPGSR